MNIRDLRYLVAVAEHRNFGKAAAYCHVSQPTLSGQIQKLETYLGSPVFERSQRKVRVTAFGERVLAGARRVLTEIEAIEALGESADDPFAGVFRLGAFPTLAAYIFPRIVEPIGQEFPELKLILVEDKTATLTSQIKSGKLDAALLALPIEDAALSQIALFRDPFYLAVWPGHPMAQREEIDQQELVSTRLLLLEEGHCLRDHALEVCSITGAAEDADFRATSLETLRQMVRARTGITLMPQVAIRAKDGLCYVRFEAPEPSRSIGLIFRNTGPSVALNTKMAKLIQGVMVMSADRQF